LTQADRAELLRVGKDRPFAPGEYLCRQGTVGDYTSLIMEGTAKVLVSDVDGLNTMLGLCGPGDLVGELSALRGEGVAQDASVIAVDRVMCRVITYTQFRRLLGDRPGIQRAITLLLADRLRLAAASKLHSAAYPVTTRVAQALLDLAEQHGTPSRDGTLIDLAISQQDLAQLVGGSRESVVRALADLRGRQMVRTGRQRIILRDPTALRAYAASPI
jgi:CRP-like cAMP-binding protein